MKRFTLLAVLFLVPSLWGINPKASCVTINWEEFNYYAKQDVRIEMPIKLKKGDNKISIVLSKPILPSGYMVSAFFDIIQQPKGPEAEVTDGYPYSNIRFFQAGFYTIEGKVNLVYRGS